MARKMKEKTTPPNKIKIHNQQTLLDGYNSFSATSPYPSIPTGSAERLTKRNGHILSIVRLLKLTHTESLPLQTLVGFLAHQGREPYKGRKLSAHSPSLTLVWNKRPPCRLVLPYSFHFSCPQRCSRRCFQ